MITFEIENQIIKLKERTSGELIENQLNFVPLKFIFGDSWIDLNKTIQFRQGNGENEKIFNIIADDSNMIYEKLPSKLKNGVVYISVKGERQEKNEAGENKTVKQVETNAYVISIAKSGFKAREESLPEEPQPSQPEEN